MKAYGEAKVRTHSFLTLALDGRDWSAAHPGSSTPQREKLLDKKKLSYLYSELNDYNSVRRFVRVWKLVADFEGEM